MKQHAVSDRRNLCEEDACTGNRHAGVLSAILVFDIQEMHDFGLII